MSSIARECSSSRQMSSSAMIRFLILVVALVDSSFERDVYHHWREARAGVSRDESAEAPEHWAQEARAGIAARLAQRARVHGVARNVVMFLGDGMSVPTLTAARTLLGQRRGQTGEEARLAFEDFPTVGLAKTYCVDAQIADSACTATAYLCGAKTNLGTIGVWPAVARRDCAAAIDANNHVHSIAAWALQAGKDAGIVTTTRVTHASPAGAFAHTAQRDWEDDAELAAECAGADAQRDIAHQLVHSFPGNDFKVILGGGRRGFLPADVVDEEGSSGKRLDGANLIENWKENKRARNATYEYVWNREQLMKLSDSPPDYILGLFESSHMQYHMEADPSTEPTLAEMTEIAIKSLSRNENGFFLFVEGGRIDHAHHDNYARLALDETIEMSEAVARATALLAEEDSLVVVTSDHAHVMSLNGYTHRGSDILGPSDQLGGDALPYMTLSYGNGPGYRPEVDGLRADVTQLDYSVPDFRYPAAVPLDSETHGGDDVAVFAWGAHHDMFSGLYEQSQLPHLMAYAGCFGSGPTACSPDTSD